MTEGRHFSRFRPVLVAGDSGIWTVPEGGLCLSAFLLIRQIGSPDRVLLGRVHPNASWDELAALDSRRLKGMEKSWVLPASHLLFFESPHEAARRILKEQLHLTDLPLEGPRVFSESYGRSDLPDAELHWDVHFIFRGDLEKGAVPRAPEWAELKWMDPKALLPNDFGRNHGDIIRLAGPS